MVELAILVPVLVMLFLGSWTATALAGDNDTALQATQAGARYAAELGASLPSGQSASTWCQANAGDADTCQVDMDIIQEMLPTLRTNFANATPEEIAIYQPNGSGNGCTFAIGTCPPTNGSFVPGFYRYVDAYPMSGLTVLAPTTLTYTLGLRNVSQPYESELGVALVFSYTSPAWSLFTVSSDTQYSVVRLAPEG